MIILSVCLATYNHEKFISEAIEGALMQQTDFSFEIIIGEDSSTDKTREICLEYKNKYPDKIRLILQEQNVGLVKNTISLLEDIKVRGIEYIAMLDGDDYWTDPFKLQKQVSFMRVNPDFGLVHTGSNLLLDGEKIKKPAKKMIRDGNVSDVIKNYNIKNCTVLFRTVLLELLSFRDFIENEFLVCDYVMYVIFARHSKVKYLEDVTTMRRYGHISVSNPQNFEKQMQYLDNDLRIWKYLNKIFPDDFDYSEPAAESYRNKRIFDISLKYNNFNQAREIYKKHLKNSNISFFKRMAASNFVFFRLYQLTKKIKNSFSSF
jgi:glycosyltransferase involved in cell wall biosynthesis